MAKQMVQAYNSLSGLSGLSAHTSIKYPAAVYYF